MIIIIISHNTADDLYTLRNCIGFQRILFFQSKESPCTCVYKILVYIIKNRTNIVPIHITITYFYALLSQQWAGKCSFYFIIFLSLSHRLRLYVYIHTSEHFPIEWIRISQTTRRDLQGIHTPTCMGVYTCKKSLTRRFFVAVCR